MGSRLMSLERNYSVDYQNQQIEQQKISIDAEAKNRRNAALVERKKRRTLFHFVLIGLVMVLFVASAAYSSSLAYNNNAMVEQNETINANIQELKVKIQSTMNIGMVENVALNKLGMIYPTESQIVQLGNGKNINNFSEVLRKEAFK